MDDWNQQIQNAFNRATKGEFNQLRNLKDNVWFINDLLIERLRKENLLSSDGEYVWFLDLKIFNTTYNQFEKPYEPF